VTTEQTLQSATDKHRAGELAEARRLYALVLRAAPNDAAALFRSGLLELQDHRPEAALRFLEEAVRIDPREPRHLLGLGQALQTLARWDGAASAYARAVELDPRSPDAQQALGVARQALGQIDAAIAAYRIAADLQPDSADALNNLADCLQRRGRLEEAAGMYRQVLARQPGDARALSSLGVAELRLGHVDTAIELQRRALELQPLASSYALNLAIALCERREFAAAESVLRRLLAREPANAEAAFNLGLALHGEGRLADSAAQYLRATLLRPGYADAFNNLGNVHKELGDFATAAAAYEAAVRAEPGSVAALNNAGCLMRTLGRLDEAETLLRRALQLEPGRAALLDNLGSVLKDAGELDAAIDCFRRSLALDPDSAATHSNLVYALSFQCLQPEPILAEARRWNARFAAPLAVQLRPHGNPRDPERRLRIGYVSADFREHCQSLFTIPLLEAHDRRGFEVTCYSSVIRTDETTHRIASLAARWRDVRALDDAALGEMVRADGIDILVDLTMHMADGRPLLFARKPAPIQAAWLAYPGTTGLGAIDYRYSDPRLDPPDCDQDYSERTLRLPDSFWCYDPQSREPQVGAPPALERGFVTFGCLNNPCKLTDSTLELWGAVFKQLPDARLLLMARAGRQRELLLRRLAAMGIAAAGVSFVPFRPRAQYLRSYHEIDIGLDTFPYNGHTTSLDALWMGVPVVSRVGRTCVGRGGLSQSFQLDLVELAADSDAGFAAAAIGLARDLPRLASLRAGLRERLVHSPLMDGARFARHLEASYRQIWREYCATRA
jgi:predicted O-linked N-acetylglucosamine transferase (SPINDLY family)